jgi:hypothetical protein
MAIHGLWKVFRKPQMQIKEIHLFLEDIFHGNEKTGVVSQVYQVLHGLPPFDTLYDRQTDIVTTPNSDSSNTITSLVIKKELSQSEVVIMAGRDITQKVLEQTFLTKPELVRGRKLHSDALTAFKNITSRKALGVLRGMPEVTFIDDEIQYKSGISEEEVKEKFLDKMYVLLTTTTTTPGTVNVDDADGSGSGSNSEDAVDVVVPPKNNNVTETTRPKG